MFHQLAILLGSLVLAQAHFTLNYPPSRGFNEGNEVNFCDGFNNPSANRTEFPIGGTGIVTITSEHPMAELLVGLSTLNDPTMFTDFNHTQNGTAYPFLVPFIVMHAQGDACLPVNPSSLGISEVHDGANATIMVQFDGPDGVLYQCADIVLSANATVPSSVKCDNATGAFPTSTSPASSQGQSGSGGSGNAAIPLSAISYITSSVVIGFAIATLVLV